ncbi:MAG TPA: alcohol acetyltransferase [Candidatus Acetatifactor stercoripullorum]|uniref:Alcohol acetyltransferase n=1 Tax=Candidatus Acetatifactor stercoripullorum TaxID=2838414 RepID=A0A9D1R6C8_9FIRM|nr:alcohol acetyltransferase [uncultured Acetatifactor sp.]HIW81857.1 alcohol acetyltransferase [Candidatus Acetatifactor stercoripullorum]
MEKGVRRDWYKLDLSAIVYPTLQRRDFSSVYRLSVLLKEEIDPRVLQQAVDMTLPRFPTYKAAIRKGLFWRYLEPNNRPGPFVQEDVKNPCQPMYFKANNRYLVKVYYYRNRIALEAHHSLGDGTGGMCVLQTLVAVYLRLLGHEEIENGGFVLDIGREPDPEELEDAYMRYANAKVRPPRPGEKTYRVRGTKEPFYTLNIIDGIMSVSQVMAVAKKYNATITEYLNAVLLYALLTKQEKDWHLRLRPVKIAMPVNLRRFFPSKTLRNFITMIYPGVDPRLGDYTFEEIVTQVHNYMRYYLNEKFLRGDITTNAATQKNPLIRVVPLFIKDFVVRMFYTKVQDKNSSAGLTNMGAIKVPEGMKPYIERFDIYMGQPFSSRTNCAIVSFDDILTINFASSIIEADVERYFFRKLVSDGIHVKIESNREITEE